MKTCFIFNPCSGKNRRNPWLARAIPAFIAEHGMDARLLSTEAPGHATVLARTAIDTGCDRVVAVGGDGTLNEVAQAVAGTRAALALVPCGSGNGLALHLGVPVSPMRALQLLLEGNNRIEEIDTGEVDGHLFFNIMGLGFDAEISRRFNLLKRRGLPNYIRAGLAAYRSHQAEQVTVTCDGRSACLSAFLVAVTNSDQYGNNARLAPGARVDDGLLDLIAVRPTGLLNASLLAIRLFTGGFDRNPAIVRRSAAHFVIERARPGLFHTDGETHHGGARLEVVVNPRHLRIAVPATHAQCGPRTRAYSEKLPAKELA